MITGAAQEHHNSFIAVVLVEISTLATNLESWYTRLRCKWSLANPPLAVTEGDQMCAAIIGAQGLQSTS